MGRFVKGDHVGGVHDLVAEASQIRESGSWANRLSVTEIEVRLRKRVGENL